MQKIVMLVCWLVSFASPAQTPHTDFTDVPIITENSVGRARIGMPVAELRKLYSGYEFAPIHLTIYGFDDDADGKPNGILVSHNGAKLFIYFADWQTKQKVAGLIALHSAYQTAKGIRVGSTSAQLKTVDLKMKVVPNTMRPDFQIAFAGTVEKPGLEYIFVEQPPIGNYAIADEPADIKATNAKISWIQIRSNW